MTRRGSIIIASITIIRTVIFDRLLLGILACLTLQWLRGVDVLQHEDGVEGQTGKEAFDCGVG